ncbi:MAG: PD-(D/E)XK nuclease family protein, partial [Firmicutes bacterium]|nr:PD-(D/E)XK nuclease family protein [Bacillota bacterium]
EEYNIPIDLQRLSSEASADALGFLERHYADRAKVVFEGDASSLEVVAAENKRAEVRRMARRICDLKEQGYRNEDIGICFRDISGYEKYIEDIFESYGIPCFVDDAYSLLHHPIFRFCAGILRVKEEKWSFPSVFALLKSGLFPISAYDCDLLENYCLAHGIKGRRFYQEKDWQYQDAHAPEDLEKVNDLRRRMREDLMRFTDKIKKEDTAENYAAILWDFIEFCRCGETVEEWCRREETFGHLKKSAELSAGLGALCDMLDQVVAAFPQRKFALSEFTELLKMGASAVKVRTIPSQLDAVEISILGQSRPSCKKVVFLGGVNEGIFPSGITDGGFLNIADRTLLKEHTELWLQDKLFYYESEDLLVYQGLTLATERLIFSYSLAGDEGRAYPSPLIDTVKKLFPGVKEVVAEDDIGDGGYFYSLDEVLGALPLSLRENDVLGWDKVKATLTEDRSVSERMEQILSSLDYTGQSKFLSDDSLKIYPGKDLSMSVSSIELFRRCPFSYFARYGLRLEERKILEFAAPDLGNIFHEILCELMQYMRDTEMNWEDVGKLDRDLIQGKVSEKLNAFAGETLFPEEHLGFITHILSENLNFIIEMMAMQVEAGDRFRPILWEVPFGKGKVLPPYIIDIGEGERKISLRGIIDRVDEAEINGEKYFRIVDYKSSGKDLSMDDLYYGISPQLPVYSIVLEQGKERVHPGGIFYQSMKDVTVKDRKTLRDDKLKEKLKSEMSLKGYIIGDGAVESCYPEEKGARILTVPEYNTVRSHTEKKIGRIGEDIFRGRTEIRPYLRKQFSSCNHCAYDRVCGYESALMGKEERLPVMKDAEAKERMYREGDGNGIHK